MIYLILHKVLGEPTFDVAEKTDGNEWVTSSGHVAYPIGTWTLYSVLPEVCVIAQDTCKSDPGWESLQDYCDNGAKTPISMPAISDILSRILPTIRRRI